MEITIKNIYPVKKPNSKVKAFCEVIIGPIEVRDIKLMEGNKGLFLSLPSKTAEYGGKTHYIPYVEIVDKNLMKKLHHDIYVAYQGLIEKKGD